MTIKQANIDSQPTIKPQKLTVRIPLSPFAPKVKIKKYCTLGHTLIRNEILFWFGLLQS